MPVLNLRDASTLDGNIFRVTAADFNGKEFDGAPLVSWDGKPFAVFPDYLAEAMRQRIILIDNRNCDYAWFGVERRETGDVQWAGPGDFLVWPDPSNHDIFVVPGPVMKLILESIGEDVAFI